MGCTVDGRTGIATCTGEYDPREGFDASSEAEKPASANVKTGRAAPKRVVDPNIPDKCNAEKIRIPKHYDRCVDQMVGRYEYLDAAVINGESLDKAAVQDRYLDQMESWVSDNALGKGVENIPWTAREKLVEFLIKESGAHRRSDSIHAMLMYLNDDKPGDGCSLPFNQILSEVGDTIVQQNYICTNGKVYSFVHEYEAMPCFTASTEIALYGGGSMPIAEIAGAYAEGIYLPIATLAADGVTIEPQTDYSVSVHGEGDYDIRTLVYENEAGDVGVIPPTPNHQIGIMPEDGTISYLESANITEGATLYLLNGKTATVTGAETVTVSGIKVYSIHMNRDNPNHFANGALVHNKM